ncbi:MAG: SDR family NAD(P)-dependent oxidoreductase [Solirubrobacteraceae bacterium]
MSVAAGGSPRPRRVLLLGGTSEIGLAIVGALAQEGPIEVALLGRDGHALAHAGEGLAARGCAPKHLSAELDASARARHGALVREASDALGGVDVVVLALGALGGGDPLADVQSAVELLDVNVCGAGSLMLHGAAALERTGGGKLVVLSSAAAVRARRTNPVYGASKAGLDALARSLGDALAGEGVDVIIVRPGYVRTRMTSGMAEPPLACSKEQVAAATVRALRRGSGVVWVPAAMRWAMLLLSMLPRSVYRRLPL